MRLNPLCELGAGTTFPGTFSFVHYETAGQCSIPSVVTKLTSWVQWVASAVPGGHKPLRMRISAVPGGRYQ